MTKLVKQSRRQASEKALTGRCPRPLAEPPWDLRRLVGLGPQVREGLGESASALRSVEHESCGLVLHNPRYVGAFTYGRRRQRRGPDGRTRHTLQPREAWTSLIPDAHPGYISWDTFEQNQRRLAESAQAHGTGRASPRT